MNLREQAAQEYHRAGGNYFRLGMLNEAADAFQKSLSIDPTNARVLNDLGNVYMGQNKVQDAIWAFQSAIRIDPGYHEPHNNLGIAYCSIGKVEEAIEEFKRTQELKPDYPDAYNNLGAICYDIGKYDEAIFMYEKALALKPDYQEARQNLQNARERSKFQRAKEAKRNQQISQSKKWFWLLLLPVIIYCIVLDFRLGALLVAASCAGWLIVGLNYDLHTYRQADIDYYESFPLVARFFSIIKETFKFLIPTMFISYLLIMLRTWLSVSLGWLILPKLFGSANIYIDLIFMQKYHPFWVIVILLTLIMTAYKAGQASIVPPEYYDIFISYKSQNAEVARQVAERLIASGVKAWFAEYQLLLDDQIMFQESGSEDERTKLINAAIQHGIERSLTGLVLTNNLYTKSGYCKSEAEKLLELRGPQRVFEVMAPPEEQPHQKIKELSKCSSMTFNKSIDEVMVFLANQTGWRMDPGLPVQPKLPYPLFQGEYMGRPYTIDMGVWELKDRGSDVPDPSNQKGPVFRRMVEDGLLVLTLRLGTDFGIENTFMEQKRAAADQGERELYDHLIYTAKEHITALGARPRGIHLVFQGDFSQFALTYRYKGNWQRMYSIILRNPVSNQIAEFVFTFGTTIPSFKGFCKYAYLFDEMANSLKWS